MLQFLRVPGGALLAVALGFLNLGLAGAARDSPRVANRSCREFQLQHEPGWTISGSWSDDGSTLLVVDAFNNQVLRYTDRGAYQGPVGSLTEVALKDSVPAIKNFTPSVMKGQGSGRYLELAQARFLRLNQNLTPATASPIDLKLASQRAEESIQGIYQWDLAANEAVVFGDIERPNIPDPEQQWRSGFFRISLESPSDFRSLFEMSPQDTARLFYRLGNPLIASIGETSYILMMEEHPRIYRSRKGESKLEPALKSFPESLSERPALPSWKTVSEYAWLMQVVERSTMPVALFGWEGNLFVVGRQSEDGGIRTRWSLTKIDPQADRIVWTTDVPLASTTHHVTVVPGPQQWAWIEKGIVRGLFNQDIDRVMFLPSEILRGTPSRNACR